MVVFCFVLLFNSFFVESKVLTLDIKHVFDTKHMPGRLHSPVDHYRAEARQITDHDEDHIIWDGIDGNHDLDDFDIKKGRLFTRRKNRATQAGYTNNGDTCKLYNENLEKVWKALSKFMDSNHGTPNKMALHNIMLLVKAYLDHHLLLNKDDDDKDGKNAIQGNVPEILNEIKDLLGTKPEQNDEETPNKMFDVIVNSVNTINDKKYEKCYEASKEKLKITVYKEYEKYIEFSNCRRVNSNRVADEDLEKMSLNEAKKFLRQWRVDPVTNCSTVARNTFLEVLKAVINSYILDMQCL